MHHQILDVVGPLCTAINPRTLVLVGAQDATRVAGAIELADAHGAALHVIDPQMRSEVAVILDAAGNRVVVHEELSLNALTRVSGADLVMLGGDPNWFTVINELRTATRGIADAARLPVIVVSATGWPYGRRDGYDDPARIPAGVRQPAEPGGVVPGRSSLVPEGGLFPDRFNAIYENTPQNGVLTAVEDFVEAADIPWTVAHLPGFLGTSLLISDRRAAEHPELKRLVDEFCAGPRATAHAVAIELARVGLLAAGPALEPQRPIPPDAAEPGADREELERLRVARADAERSRKELEARLADLLTAEPETTTSRPSGVQALSLVSSHLRPGLPQPDAGAEAAAERAYAELFAQRYLECTDGPVVDEDGVDLLSPGFVADRHGLLRTPHESGAVADVVVCVHNALADVQQCLTSVLEMATQPFGLIVVDDGSDLPTRRYLDRFATLNPAVQLIHNDTPRHGYTIAANIGLQTSTAPVTVLLNSDTIVTPGWLEAILDRFADQPQLGIAGPLSNAASLQSVPLVREDGRWATNPLPEHLTIAGMARLVATTGLRADPVINFINGFCYAVRREVIDAIGYLDEERFASGYCEENDYTQRARDAGWHVGVVEDAYVYHAKSKSYTVSGRDVLAKRNYEIFLDKHGREKITALVKQQEADTALEPIRAALRATMQDPASVGEALFRDHDPLSVVFILPGLSVGGSGGSHSVYQEVRGMQRFGVPARIAIPRDHWARAHDAYDDADRVFFPYDSAEHLAEALGEADVVSATHFKSIATLADLRQVRQDFLPAYYVQDYEPFFIGPTQGEDFDEAMASYTALPDLVVFAKTHWLCNVVRRAHGVHVHKVQPSLDRAVFHPADQQPPRDVPHVVAMVRRKTPRRQPATTVTVLRRLRAILGDRVQVTTFGCTRDELAVMPGGEELLDVHRGILRRDDVAELLRSADVFLDLSMYQAFGRTALEAMACGATVVVPRLGGAAEFLRHGENGLSIDTLDGGAALGAVLDLLADRATLDRMRAAAVATAADYSIERAALSEYLMFKGVADERAGAAAGSQTWR